MKLAPAPQILDCTLRDGSYVIDFQFTADDTATIGSALDSEGFPYIEVGHGVGLGASENSPNIAAATDLEYMQAAARSITSGKWGMFCIPGVATLDHVRRAADSGMGFIRVGTDVDKADTAAPFIALARELGIEVFANFMKSYVLEPAAFGKLAARAEGFGAEMVYLVDSAGGMLPSEVRLFLQAAKSESSNLPLGFHGHDNLGLAVANSLASLEEGVTMVDCSLQGFGRSSGNTPTELFLGATLRSGYSPFADSINVMNLGETLIRPLIERRGFCSLDVTAGQALFHSSYMPKILRVARQKRIDPRRLIVDLCEQNKVDAPDDLLNELAEKIQQSNIPPHVFVAENYYGEEQ